MLRTGNFQAIGPRWSQLKGQFERETARVDTKNGNFRSHFHDSIAVRRSYPPVAPLTRLCLPWPRRRLRGRPPSWWWINGAGLILTGTHMMVSTPMRLGKRIWPSSGMQLYTSSGPTQEEKGPGGKRKGLPDRAATSSVPWYPVSARGRVRRLRAARLGVAAEPERFVH